MKKTFQISFFYQVGSYRGLKLLYQDKFVNSETLAVHLRVRRKQKLEY